MFKTSLVAISIALAGASAAVAQSGTATGDAAAAQPQPTKADMAQQGASVVERARSLSKRVSSMLAEARRENDIIRVTCLSDKMSQVGARQGAAEGRLGALKSASDAAAAAHEFNVLMVIGQKLQELSDAAGQCVGESMFDTGSTKVQTDIQPDSQPAASLSSDVLPSLAPEPTPGTVDQTVTLTPASSPVVGG